MKTSKLAKRKKNYSLVQVVHQLKLCDVVKQPLVRHMTGNTVISQDAVAKWEVARRRDVSASERAEVVSQLLQQVGICKLA